MKYHASKRTTYLHWMLFIPVELIIHIILLSSAFDSWKKLYIVASLGNLRSTGSCLCLWLSRTILPPLSLELLFWRVMFAGTFGTEMGAGVEGGRGTGTGAGVGGGDGAEGVSTGLGPYSILCFYKKTNNQSLQKYKTWATKTIYTLTGHCWLFICKLTCKSVSNPYIHTHTHACIHTHTQSYLL